MRIPTISVSQSGASTQPARRLEPIKQLIGLPFLSAEHIKSDSKKNFMKGKKVVKKKVIIQLSKDVPHTIRLIAFTMMAYNLMALFRQFMMQRVKHSIPYQHFVIKLLQ